MARYTKEAISLATTGALLLTPMFASAEPSDFNMQQDLRPSRVRPLLGPDGAPMMVPEQDVVTTTTVTTTRKINPELLRQEERVKNPKSPMVSVVKEKTVGDCGKGKTTYDVHPRPAENPLQDEMLAVEQVTVQTDETYHLNGGFAVSGSYVDETFLLPGESTVYEQVVPSNDIFRARAKSTMATPGKMDAIFTSVGKVFTFNTVFQFGNFRYHGLPSDNYSYDFDNSSTGGSVGDVSAKTGAVTNNNSAETGAIDLTQNNKQTNDQNAYQSSWTNVEQELKANISSKNIANAEADASAKAKSVNNPYSHRPDGNGCKKNKWGKTECNY